jgi:sodium pump decarboxylase gamma subunit
VSNLGQGFAIMIMGLGITFAALGLFIGLIVSLNRLFPPETETSEEQASENPSPVNLAEQGTADEELVAAIAAALAHLHSSRPRPGSLGDDLLKGPSTWWVAGRLAQVPLGSSSTRGRR